MFLPQRAQRFTQGMQKHLIGNQYQNAVSKLALKKGMRITRIRFAKTRISTDFFNTG